MTTEPIVILGAGLAGLTAASFLHRHGVPVRVFEASPYIAGLARSERDEDGFTYDCGAHFITNRLAAAIGCSATCRHMDRYGETVHYRNRNYSYPFGLLSSPSLVASAFTSKITGLGRQPAVTVAEHYTSEYGRKISQEIAVPLTEAWSGVSGDQLSAAVGQKFATGPIRTMYLTIMKRLRRKTLGIGYSGTFPESTSVWHVYPEGGVGAVCESLAKDIKPFISTRSPVQAILTENDRVTGVQVNDQIIPTAHLISTAPVHVLPKLVRGTSKLEYLSKFEYRAMVFVNLKLDGPSGLPDVVTWMPEKQFVFFRLSDIGLGLPFLVPEGKTQVTCDIGCRVDDDIWSADDSELTQRCLADLEAVTPGVSKKFIGSRIVRTRLAYPIFKLDYEADRLRFKQSTGVEGLVSVGRNGEFDHILMEDVYWRTRRKMISLLDQLHDAGATHQAKGTLPTELVAH